MDPPAQAASSVTQKLEATVAAQEGGGRWYASRWTRRGLVMLYATALLGISVFHTLDHAAWMAADQSPMTHSDTPNHLGWTAGGWWQYLEGTSDAGFPFMVGAYPPAVYLTAFPFFYYHGVSLESVQLAQVPYTFLLCLGMGLLAWRALGPWAGLAAATAVFTYPEMWVQRAEVQLDMPLAGSLALAFALLPSPRRPGARLMAVASGLTLALALYTKQAMIPVVGGAMTYILLRAGGIYMLARRKGKSTRPVRLHLLDVLIACGIAGVLAGPWYVNSLFIILDAMSNTWNIAVPPTGMDWIYAKVGLITWLLKHFMQAPHFWCLAAGLLCLPWLQRRTAMMGPAMAGLMGGLVQFASLPTQVERHFAALTPLFILLSLAPLGLLRGSWLRRAAAGPMCAVILCYGLYFSWSWREPPSPNRQAERLRMPLGPHNLHSYIRPSSPQWLMSEILTPPSSFYLKSPRPTKASWPLHEVISTLAATRKGPKEERFSDLHPWHPRRSSQIRDHVPLVLVRSSFISEACLQAEASLQREYRFLFQSVQAHELTAQVHQRDQAGREIFLLVMVDNIAPATLEGYRLKELGFKLMRSWTARLQPYNPLHGIYLYRLHR